MNKPFKPTYLYIKTHNVTGLKYFGKTVSNRKSYKGSGTYWTRHLKKHGNDVTTEIVGYFTDRDECEAFALNFSVQNNIVDSKEWANHCLENGVCGGDTFGHKTPEQRQLILEKRKSTFESKTPEELAEIKRKNSEGVKKYIAENPEAHKIRSQKGLAKKIASGTIYPSSETREKISKNNKSRTQEVKDKISKSLTGRKNPEHSTRMSLKTGLNGNRTQLFEVVSPEGDLFRFIGCKELRQFCKDNGLAYEQFIKHLNTGKIDKILAQRPRPDMKKCLGYELKEINRRA